MYKNITRFFKLGGIFIKYRIFLISILSAIMLLSGCSKPVENKPVDNEVVTEEQPEQTEDENKEERFYTNYNATVEFSPDTNSIKGIEKITYKNTTSKKQHEIYMNIYANSFNEDSPILPYANAISQELSHSINEYANFNISSLTVGGKEVSYSVSGSSLCIQLPETLEVNGETEIAVQFESSIPNMSYAGLGKNENIFWTGNIIPVMAVYDNYGWNKSVVYPLWDTNYNDIGNYTISIKTPEEYTVLGTGNELVNSSDGVKTTVVEGKFIRDFAFAIGKNLKTKSIQKDENSTKINVYYYSDDTPMVDLILENVSNMVDYYGKICGTYPYSHIDIVETSLYRPDNAQFSGMAFVDESFFSADADINAFVLDFDLGYQWFSGIVETDVKKEPWIREGLSEFLNARFLYGEDGIDAYMEVEYANLKGLIEGEKHQALSTPPTKYTTEESFETVQRKKSAMMMYALYNKIGAEKFDEFLKTYVSEYSFKTATSNEFFRIAEDVYGKSLYSFFNDWVNGNKLPKVHFDTAIDEVSDTVEEENSTTTDDIVVE